MKAQRVVVVVWAGGTRASETILDPRHRHVPRIWNDLRPKGTLLSRLYNDGWTNHGPSLQALATGRWEVREYNEPRPAGGRTLVDAARRQGRSAHVMGPSPRRALLLAGGDASATVTVNLSAEPAPFTAEEAQPWNRLRSFDRPMVARFLDSADDRPDLSFLLFDDTDVAHQGRWSWYVNAIRQSDELVWKLWTRLEREGGTDLLVLSVHGRADHGHTRWGFRGHGRQYEGCSRLFLLALGPDFCAGRVVERRWHSRPAFTCWRTWSPRPGPGGGRPGLW